MTKKLKKLIGSNQKNAKITVNTLHKAKVVARRRVIDKLKLDNDAFNKKLIDECEPYTQLCPPNYRGTHYRDKKDRLEKRSRLRFYFWIVIGLGLLFVWLIEL